MQKRKIMVANSEDHTRKVIESEAETLGELKHDFDVNGIYYEGLDITEGISRTSLLHDSSQLPRQLSYKKPGTDTTIITDDLVILITRTKKKTSSGTLSRKEIYAVIKEFGIKDQITTFFGNNYTHISSQDLVNYLQANNYLKGMTTSCYEADESNENRCKDNCNEYELDKCIASAMGIVLLTLNNLHALSKEDITYLRKIMEKIEEEINDHDTRTIHLTNLEISNSEIDKMMDALQLK